MTDGEVLLEYLPKLIRLAERNMSRGLRAKIGSDEMANSILGSVIRMEREGKLPVSIEESEDFWRLIVRIGKYKICNKARYYGAAKRDISREMSLPEDQTLEEMIADMGEPDDQHGERVAAVLDRLQELLDDNGQIVLAGKLEGLTDMQIAPKLAGGEGRSTRTVRRIWQEIQKEANDIVDAMGE